MEVINSYPNFDGAFGDKRLEKRASDTLRTLAMGRSSSIRQITQTEAEQRSIYRLLDNKSFTEKAIEERIIQRCNTLCKDRHVLCIQDTVEFNLESAGNRLKSDSGTGDLSKNGVQGFFLHSSLVVDANSYTAIGYSSIKTWHRENEREDKHKRHYKLQPIEEKESYKWMEAATQSKKKLSEASRITVVADREADIYELFCLAKRESIDLVLRSRADRVLVNKQPMKSFLNSLPVMHNYELPILGDIRKGISKRIAHLQVKWSEITIKKPLITTNKNLTKDVTLYVVETKEKGTKGVCWRLLTTHPVNNAQDAMQVIEWYKQRWYIEQVHRLLKTQGFRIESSQLSKGYAIRKLTLLAMMASLRIIQMMLAYEDDAEQDASIIFNNEEQKCLSQIGQQMKGNTEKQSNPHTKGTIKWATWIIARLGGWKAYRSQRKPGPIVLQKGLIKFYTMFEGWNLYQNSRELVYTQ